MRVEGCRVRQGFDFIASFDADEAVPFSLQAREDEDGAGTGTHLEALTEATGAMAVAVMQDMSAALRVGGVRAGVRVRMPRASAEMGQVEAASHVGQSALGAPIATLLL